MKVIFPFLLLCIYHVNVILGVVICVNDGVSLQKAVTTSSSAINETIYIEFCGVNTIDLTGTGDSYGTDIVALNKVIDIQCSKQFKKCTFINGTFSVRESIIRIHNIDFNNTQFRSEYNSQINISSSTFRNTNNDQVVNAFDSSISLHDVIFENNKLIQRTYGIIYVDNGDYVNLSNVKIDNNSAQHILSVRNIKTISIINTEFISNFAINHVASLANATTVSLQNVTFRNNQNLIGYSSVFMSVNCKNVAISKTIFDQNSFGSTAVFFSGSNSDVIIKDTSFMNNTAFLTSALELSGINATIRNVQFVNNTGIEKRINEDIPTSLMKATTVTIQSSDVILDNCSFIGNKGKNGITNHSTIIVDYKYYPWLYHNTSLSCNNTMTSFLDNGNISRTFLIYPRNVYTQSFSTCLVTAQLPVAPPSPPVEGFFGRIRNWFRSVWKWLLGQRTE